jgi:Rod binding domain-containing protein
LPKGKQRMAMKIFRPHISRHQENGQGKEKLAANADPHRLVPKKYREFAADMEQQFAKHMIEQMNKSSQRAKSNEPGSDYYQDLLQNQQAKSLTAGGSGLGIQKMILDDIYPKKFRNEAAFKAYQQNQIKNNKRPHELIATMGPQDKESVEKHKQHDINIGVPNKTGVHDE